MSNSFSFKYSPHKILHLHKSRVTHVGSSHHVHTVAPPAPQELPKYLRGYHNCTREDMISLAGLLFRVKVDIDKSQFVMIPRMLKELVPADQLKSMSSEEWKKVQYFDRP